MVLGGVLLAAGSFAGCDDFLDPGPEGSDPPPLPPVESLEADLAFFHNRDPAPDGSTAGWDAATERIPFVASVTRRMAIPLDLLRDANTRTPEIRGDLEWHWPVEIEQDSQTLSGHLAGAWGPFQIDWAMFLSIPEADPPVSNHVWAVGAMSHDGRIGRWSIRGPEDETTAGVTWALPPGGGSELSLATEPNAHFEIRRNGGVWTIDYFAVDDAERFQIAWNADTGAGRVALAGSDPMCWNAQLHDSACIGL